MPDTPSLAAALAALTEAAAAAGIDPDVARAEGEAFAATVAESATGAWQDWSAQTGGDRSAEEFTTPLPAGGAGAPARRPAWRASRWPGTPRRWPTRPRSARSAPPPPCSARPRPG